MTSAAQSSRRTLRPQLSVEVCLLFVCIYFVAVCNTPFWNAVLAGREAFAPSTALFAVSLFVALALLHFVVLGLFCNRWTAKPLLMVLVLATAVAASFIQIYGVHIDGVVFQSILRTDFREAKEYVSRSLMIQVLIYSAAPLVFLAWVELRRPHFVLRAALARIAAVVVALLIAGAALFAISKDLVPLMRTQRALRYLITPGNFLVAGAKAAVRDANPPSVSRRHANAVDDHVSAKGKTHHKPVLFVLVVGETARGGNFALNGYPRPTNPRLSKLDIINFPEVSSCGTATEVSLPCLFSAVGRQRFSTDQVASNDGLLQVLTHARYQVYWLDNNSGCKGACDGDGIVVQQLPEESEEGCTNGGCLDSVLLDRLKTLSLNKGFNNFVVLHQLGGHGPAYYRRYPPTFAQFTPTCDTNDLRSCTQEQIVNTYDNVILYTDSVIADLIGWLRTQAADYETAMLYVGDHGESLGERGVYLHGLPYSIAPRDQTHVPMVLWMSDGFRKDFNVDARCARERAQSPASHDNVFHSIAGLLSVRTPQYRSGLDVFASCRPPPFAGAITKSEPAP